MADGISRRDWSRSTSAAAGLAGAARATTPALRAGQPALQGATNCEMCFWRCGALAKIQNGIVTRIEGNPQHPLPQGRLCARGNAGHPAQAQLLLTRKGFHAYSLKEGFTAWWDQVMTPQSLRGAEPQPAGYQQSRALREQFKGGASQPRRGSAPHPALPAAPAPATPGAPAPKRLKLGRGCSEHSGVVNVAVYNKGTREAAGTATLRSDFECCWPMPAHSAAPVSGLPRGRHSAGGSLPPTTSFRRAKEETRLLPATRDACAAPHSVAKW